MGQKRLDPWGIAAIVVGVMLRFINLGASPLWFDETSTWTDVRITGWIASATAQP